MRMPVVLSQRPNLSTRSGIGKRALRVRQAESTRPRWSFTLGKAVDGRMGANAVPFAPAKLHQHADYWWALQGNSQDGVSLALQVSLATRSVVKSDDGPRQFSSVALRFETVLRSYPSHICQRPVTLACTQT